MEIKDRITLTLEGEYDVEQFTETDVGNHCVHLVASDGDMYFWDKDEVFKIRDFFNAVCEKLEGNNELKLS